jgi:hypothetical protein
MVKGWLTLSIKEETVSRLAAIWEHDTRRPDNQKFTAYINNMLSEFIEYNEKLHRYGAFLEYLDARDNRINLYDNLHNKSVTVYVDSREKRLRCDTHDNRSDCLHTGFCFAIPEIYKILIERGFRPPKKL